MHADEGFSAVVGGDVSVGHGAVLHGCSFGSGTIVGMGAVLMNGASVGTGGDLAAALGRITARMFAMPIDEDMFFPAPRLRARAGAGAVTVPVR